MGTSFIARTTGVLLLLAPAVRAAPGIEISETFFSQMNPRALALDLRVQSRQPLGDGPMTYSAFAGLLASPAVLRPTAGIELQPINTAAFGLSLGVAYSASWYHGLLPAQSYSSPAANYGSTIFAGPPNGPGGGYGLLVHQLALSATLQGMLGPFAARSTTRAQRFFADLHGSDRVIYDPALDVVVYKNGWVAQNDTDLLYSPRPGLAVGLRHSLTLAWYPADAYSPGEARSNPDTPISKLGPFALWRVYQADRGMVQRAEVLALAQWYVAHRFRTGDTVNGAFPLLGIGLVLSGDLQRTR